MCAISMNTSEILAREELRQKLRKDAEEFLARKQATVAPHGASGKNTHYVISKPHNRKRGSK